MRYIKPLLWDADSLDVVSLNVVNESRVIWLSAHASSNARTAIVFAAVLNCNCVEFVHCFVGGSIDSDMRWAWCFVLGHFSKPHVGVVTAIADETIVNYGLALVDGCMNTYTGTATGIGPEGFAYMASDGNFTSFPDPTDADLAFYDKNGFYIIISDYILRPEVLESNFYAWRATGDTKYLDNAARAIDSFNKYLPATVGFTGIDDVNSVNTTKTDDMESFWFAEVLKYLYLTFDDPNHISLDEYVFNTEAHPLKAPAPKASYGGAGIEIKSGFKASTGPIPVASSTSFTQSPLRIG